MTQQPREASRAWPSSATVRLELGAAASRVLVLQDGVMRELPLPLVTAEVAGLFHSDPPTGRELEAAIDLVEEAVMPLVRQLPAGAALLAGDTLTRQVVALSSGPDGTALVSIEAVERLFDQLSRAAHRGSWAGTIPMDATVSAASVILRELMHHGGFQAVGFLPTAA